MKPYSYSLLLLGLVACSQPQTTPSETTTTATVTQPPVVPQQAPALIVPVDPGKVIASLPVQNATTDSFALYLPKGFDTSVPHSIIVFFDPHGDGSVPLEKYKDLADKNNTILAGSNTSRNGASLQEGVSIAGRLIADLSHRYKLDGTHITFCGFSGGAKVAMMAANSIPTVTHVIYCGAVVPMQNFSRPISFLGIAGTHDMNYSDLLLFHQGLSATYPHYLIEWNGKHEWPEASVFQNAFLPFSSIAKNKLVVVDAAKLSAVDKENTLKQELLKSMQTQDLNWWKLKVAELRKKSATDAVSDRALGFISLACYSLGKNALNSNDLAQAEKIIAIYELADPGNGDCAIYKQQLEARKAGH